MRLFPRTFTHGEAFILSQLFAIFVQRSSIFCLAFIIFFLIERYSVSFSLGSLLFFSVIVGALVFFLYRRLSPTFSLFYSLQAKRLVCYLSVENILLLSFWLILFMVCIALVWMSRYLTDSSHEVMCLDSSSIVKLASDEANTFPAIDPTENELKSTDQSTDEVSSSHASQKKSPFWMRKVFHLAAGLVYATGILWSPGLLSLASIALLLLFITLEWIRRRGPKVLVHCLNEALDPFRDERDSGELIFTPIALLVGLSLPLWWLLSQPPKDTTVELDKICDATKLHPSVWSGVLSIAVGDSMAALVGRAWGRLRWPGTHRTLLGSTASLLSQLAVWTPIARLEGTRWSSGFLPILSGVLTEAYVGHIDNLVVPLVVQITFLIVLPV